jgi:endonuclease III
MNDDDAERYLMTLPGAGIKTARCVMMFAFGRQVLPVDTHLARIARRMGWAMSGQGSAKLHADLDAVVPPDLRYQLHVNAICFGRKICLARQPRCQICPVSRYCQWNLAGADDSPAESRAGRTMQRTTHNPGPK